jgi:hypothetical protein
MQRRSMKQRDGCDLRFAAKRWATWVETTERRSSRILSLCAAKSLLLTACTASSEHNFTAHKERIAEQRLLVVVTHVAHRFAAKRRSHPSLCSIDLSNTVRGSEDL